MLVFRFVDRKLIKFLLAGLINTAFVTSIQFIFYSFSHFIYCVSLVSCYIACGIITLFLKKYFKFINYKKSFQQDILYTILHFFSQQIFVFGEKKWILKKYLKYQI